MILNCKHVFHKDCLVKWLQRNKTCPVCRKQVTIFDNNILLELNKKVIINQILELKQEPIRSHDTIEIKLENKTRRFSASDKIQQIYIWASKILKKKYHHFILFIDITENTLDPNKLISNIPNRQKINWKLI